MHSDSLLVSALYYLLAAVVLGPHVLTVIDAPEQVLHFAEYGVVLLLFVIGLEMAPSKLWNMRSYVGVIGGGQLLLSAIAIGVGVWWLFSLTIQQSIVLGLTLGLSSTAFAIQLMNEEHILASPLGRKGFGILLLQDLAVIPILILVGVFAQASAVE